VVEYAGIVVVVALVMASLMALRPHRAGRVPLDPVRAVGALVRTAPVPRLVPPRARVVRPRVRRTPVRPRPRPRPRRPVVLVPRWAVAP
jgi:hypothetical protein